MPAEGALLSSALVGTGAAAGAALRYHSNELYLRRLAQKPIFRGSPVWGICGINICGSFALGAITAFQPRDEVKLLLGTGFCGGLTTFSTFAVESLGLARGANTAGLAAYVVLSNAGAICAAALGYAAVKALKRRRR